MLVEEADRDAWRAGATAPSPCAWAPAAVDAGACCWHKGDAAEAPPPPTPTSERGLRYSRASYTVWLDVTLVVPPPEASPPDADDMPTPGRTWSVVCIGPFAMGLSAGEDAERADNSSDPTGAWLWSVAPDRLRFLVLVNIEGGRRHVQRPTRNTRTMMPLIAQGIGAVTWDLDDAGSYTVACTLDAPNTTINTTAR